MKKEDYKIHIIGAGISGLVAAKVLENHGYSPILMESTDRVGGRVKTDLVDGYQLDHGFQVLLTAYPAAQQYLNLEALELQNFLPGATIFLDDKKKTIGDPLRNISLLIPTMFSGIGTFSDKVKILKLNRLLKKTTVSEIFAKAEKTTLQYLIDFGFSEEIIAQFFTPFFSGIFLEPELATSSRMFEFVYKMFGEGFVFQFHYLLSEFTVLENVMLPAKKLAEKTVKEIEQDALEKLKILNIEHLAHKKASRISGGEKQRVAIARALINNPSIIMGDEPTGNLDSHNAENVFNIFKKLSVEQGLLLLIVTYDKDFADKTDRIIEMGDGRVIG